ncbi:AlbA family DNA-binding domain-containing protein [Arthrobacter woluwensis]|uniref:AlbA family DNA-binding domain-containing protein n=1 Tax=Arthrobacter woluwensis TaxID=156980 RepID=UPI0015E65431|nr:ATP-binding protein [Arthrobacter woluwensis]
MIVSDGRTDREKLLELLQAPEETHLEFKAQLDLAHKLEQLKFVKDAVAMSNRPDGGYILVGVSDDGTPVIPAGKIPNRDRYDSARLGDMILKYIDGEIHPVSQIHEVNGCEVVLIYLPHHRDGLPVPMKRVGEYQEPGGNKTVVFREGEVVVRQGARNIPLRHVHWTDLLSRRDERLRNEARTQVDSLIAAVAAALRPGGLEPAHVPLSIDMGDDAFREAVISHLEAANDIRIRQFLGQASAAASSPQRSREALDKITVLAAQAMYFEKETLVAKAIENLTTAYGTLDVSDDETRLEFITRAYALGGLAVRLQQWQVVHDLVVRPYPRSGQGFVYSSWVRHGQVQASRAKLFPEGKGGMMISAARELLIEQYSMRPDIPDNMLPSPGDMTDNDVLFNSLCQFDILYCMVVEAEGQHQGGAYPAAASMNQERANPAFEVVATSETARAQMFPTSDDDKIAQAMKEVFTLAKDQSHNFGGWWWSLPQEAQQFITSHQVA